MLTFKYLTLSTLFGISHLGSSEAHTILPDNPKKYLLNESNLYLTIRDGVIILSNRYTKTRVIKTTKRENTDLEVKYYTENGTIFSLLATSDVIMFFLESYALGGTFIGNRIK
ncbi:Uncharacterised protein [Sphingobacterium daejeonense]|nr:Uncharacterised protein [Sphingobacterium daejeonense]